MRRPQRTASAGSRLGEKRGRRNGYAQGYHFGRCQSIRANVIPAVPAVRGLKVLYIPQGFPAIDQGVSSALQQSVRELVVGTPQTMHELAEQHRPDLVLVLNGLHVFPPDHLEQVERIRQLGIHTAVWFADDPYFTDFTAAIGPKYDTVLTHEQSCIPFYKSLGCPKVIYLPLAADTQTFQPQPSGPAYQSDICFIGNAFWNRAAFFDRIARYLAHKRVVIAGGFWERMSKFKLLKPQIRSGWMPVEESVKYYSGAKIVINLHRSHDHPDDNKNRQRIPAQSVNPRTYEISACGTLQLTDLRDDLTRYYTPGVELDVYRTPEELLYKIDYYLHHEEQRRTIAYNGLRRTLLEHSYLSRIGQMLNLLGYTN
ncbi:CgeB family protein [Paenibacillus gyeongsangnamensis]|uniref:CgeB family protein n=1 Tax=Paenibacillus gyeongsangnamensis TaxID=3388067 RepID=UPI0039084256